MPKISALRMYNKSRGLSSNCEYPLDFIDNRYKMLTHPGSTIIVKDLYRAYEALLHFKGIIPMPYSDILSLIANITQPDYLGSKGSLLSYAHIGPCPHMHLAGHKSVRYEIITANQYDRIKFISDQYDLYKTIRNPLWICSNRKRYKLSNTAWMVILLQLIEVVIIAFVILAKKDIYPKYLILARSSAVSVLLNIFFLLAHVANVKQWIDNKFIHLISTNSSEFFHQLFGFKILLAASLHTIGHLLHVQQVLQHCKQGCTVNMVLTVPADSLPVVISWNYFLSQPAYYTGLMLVIIMIIIGIFIVLKAGRCIRIATFYNIHRISAILFFIIIILHGLQQLLGFNLSYIFVLPIFLIYLYTRRHELFLAEKLQISKWHITDTMIRMYVINPKKIIAKLEKCIALSVWISHPKVSKYEWHPFTLVLGIDNYEGSLHIKRNGKWTMAFVEKILSDSSHQVVQYIKIGHATQSCFRFYKFYSTRIFFCSGIGITPFLTIMSNIKPDDLNTNIFIWSIGNIELIKEFEQLLNSFASHSVRIFIFYSNTAAQTGDPVPIDQVSKFNFLQTLIHYHSGVDIVHGAKLQMITLLERINSTNIISQVMNQCTMNATIGIFICGGISYSNSIKNSVDLLQYNEKNISIDLWVEQL